AVTEGRACAGRASVGAAEGAPQGGQVRVLMPVLPFPLRHLDGAGGRGRVLAVGGAPVGGAPGGGAPGGGASGGGDTVGGALGGGDTGGGDTAGPHDPHQVAVAG